MIFYRAYYMIFCEGLDTWRLQYLLQVGASMQWIGTIMMIVG